MLCVKSWELAQKQAPMPDRCHCRFSLLQDEQLPVEPRRQDVRIDLPNASLGQFISLYALLRLQADNVGFGLALCFTQHDGRVLSLDDQQHVYTRYVGYDSEALRRVEDLMGTDAITLSVPLNQVDLYRQLVHEKTAVFVPDLVPHMAQVLAPAEIDLVEQVVELLRARRAIYCPLIVQDRVTALTAVQADELTESVCKIVATVFGAPLEEITPQTTHEDLEDWDSLNLINLMIALESEFGVTLEVDDAAELLSIEKIVAVLRGRGV